jgi:hemolysin activation/secretion protein
MRVGYLCLALLLIAGLAASQQEQQTQEQPPQQPEQRKQQEQPRKPTLGPAPAPSLYGPRTSNTTDARKLMRVRRIYVERIDNSLSEKLVEGFAKTRRFRIVASRNEADAVLRGTCVSLRRMKTVHSEVYLNDMNGAAVWQDNVRRPYNPPTLEAAVSETVTLIVTHLTESALEAEHR